MFFFHSIQKLLIGKWKSCYSEISVTWNPQQGTRNFFSEEDFKFVFRFARPLKAELSFNLLKIYLFSRQKTTF